MLRVIFYPGMAEAHVIGNEVQHEPQATSLETLAQPGEGGIAAESGVYGVAGDGEA